jgi:hypothetical protein
MEGTREIGIAVFSRASLSFFLFYLGEGVTQLGKRRREKLQERKIPGVGLPACLCAKYRGWVWTRLASSGGRHRKFEKLDSAGCSFLFLERTRAKHRERRREQPKSDVDVELEGQWVNTERPSQQNWNSGTRAFLAYMKAREKSHQGRSHLNHKAGEACVTAGAEDKAVLQRTPKK